MKKIIASLVFVVALLFSSFAQRLSTPYQTVYTHLSNLQKDNYNPGISSAAIPLSITDKDEREELAIHIKQILDGKGLFVHDQAIPKEENYMDSTQRKNIYIIDPLEPRIYLEKVGQNWYYSMSTISDVDKMFNEVFPFGTKVFRKLLPVSMRNDSFLGLFT